MLERSRPRPPGRLDPLDGVGDELGVGALDGVVEVLQHDQVLAGRPVVGAQLLPQDRIHTGLEIGDAGVVDAPELGRVEIG